MIRSYQEDMAWWQRLSELDRTEMFEGIIEELESRDDDAAGFMNSVYDQYRERGTLTPKQVTAVRKFQENRE